MPSEKKVEFADPEPEPEDEDIIDLSDESDDDDDIDLEDEDLEMEDDEDGDVNMMRAFAGILQGTFHLPQDDDDEDEDTKNICEVLADISVGMEAIGKNMETQNKILLKILTHLSSKK